MMKHTLYRAIAISIAGLFLTSGLCSAQDADESQNKTCSFEEKIRMIYRKNYPSVVRIATSADREKRGCNRFGTGFVVREDGYILTMGDLVCDTVNTIVIMPDDWQYSARVTAVDPKLNIAILKIPVSGLPVVEMGESGSLDPGDLVVSITNPYGLSNTLAIGFLTGKNRSGFRTGRVENFLQTSIPLNPGDSGSPLLDKEGKLIGIMTAVLVDDANTPPHISGMQPRDISFAIPVDFIKHKIKSLIEYGEANHSWIGIEVQTLMKEDFLKYDITDKKQQYGILVTKVFVASPAHHAGLQAGDMIRTVNEKPIYKVADLQQIVIQAPIDDTIDMTIIRDGKNRGLSVKTEPMPKQIEVEQK